MLCPLPTLTSWWCTHYQLCALLMVPITSSVTPKLCAQYQLCDQLILTIYRERPSSLSLLDSSILLEKVQVLFSHPQEKHDSPECETSQLSCSQIWDSACLSPQAQGPGLQLSSCPMDWPGPTKLQTISHFSTAVSIRSKWHFIPINLIPLLYSKLHLNRLKDSYLFVPCTLDIPATFALWGCDENSMRSQIKSTLYNNQNLISNHKILTIINFVIIMMKTCWLSTNSEK